MLFVYIDTVTWVQGYINSFEHQGSASSSLSES